ncbi:hypothetical protein Fmac_017638 [Flemingia macrophylla]|uniref:F-box domain-containing protein n=1 Tax=Flemingia macrophylla TaxID=520843 RepID=A0ABD1M2N4_9FABA
MKKVEAFLNSDVLMEILSRIPAKELLSLKRVCKEWRRMISSRSFAKLHVGRAAGAGDAGLSGFILQERFVWCSDDIREVSYIPVDETARSNSTVLDFLPEDVVVLASCKGLVCCRSYFPCESPVVYVCNPCNRDCVRLDWPWKVPHYYGRKIRSVALALAFDVDASKGFIDTFKLVRVRKVEQEDEDGELVECYFTFELFSSEKGSWKQSSEICKCHCNLGKNEGLYIEGVLYWLTDGGWVLIFDVEKELACMVPPPVPAAEYTAIPEVCIGESEGRVQYVVVSEQGFHVWSLEDYYEVNWRLVYSKCLEEIEGEWPEFFIKLKKYVLERVNGAWVNPLAFKDGLLLMKVCMGLYLFDIKNNRMVQACSNIQDLRSVCMFNPIVLPYSLSFVQLSPN